MEYTALAEVFGDKLTYVIPPYQRPYSWDCIGKSDKNNQINVMWDDIFNFFNEKHKGLYFMGSMVLIPNEDNGRMFEVIDGQQRLTSTTLLLVSIKCFLSKMIFIKPDKEPTIKIENTGLENFITKAISVIDKIVYNEELIGAIPLEKKVKIAKNAEFDYDTVLQNVLECIQEPKLEELRTKYKATDEQMKIVQRYYKNRVYFEERIKEKFLTNEIFTLEDGKKMNSFIDFLQTKISFVIIKAKDFEFAYRIFETLNNRGLPLSNKDLFRNFIIEKFADISHEKPNINPTKMWNDLDTSYELKEDFLGRWVESKKAGQQKLSAFNDLKDDIYGSKKYYIPTIDKTKIELLYDDLKVDLGYYTLIIRPDDLIENVEIKNRLLFIHNCGNNRYSLNLLLALFRTLKYDGSINLILNDFLIVFEKFLLYTLLNPARRFSNSPIYESIKYLNNNDLQSALNIFKIDEKELLKYLNSEIKDNDLGKLIISKYIWYLQTTTNNDVVSQKLIYDNATLEHIIPQDPEKKSNWNIDFTYSFRDEYTYKLGNMTLLNQSLNSGAKNYKFAMKKEKYSQTNLAFTKELSMLERITEQDIKDRHEKIILGLTNDLKIRV